MPDFPRYALGRLPSPRDPRTLRFASYITPEVPEPPPVAAWHHATGIWSLGENDLFGNCVIVTAANFQLSFRANARKDSDPIADSAIVALSRQMGALNGYNILERLKWWRNRGMWADKLHAFARIHPQLEREVKIAIHEFGGADVGLNMPAAWANLDVWDTGHGPHYRPYTWGGHSVPIIGYDEAHVYCITWARIQPITWPAFITYCDEAYALIDRLWLDDQNRTPSGFDLDALERDLTAATA